MMWYCPFLFYFKYLWHYSCISRTEMQVPFSVWEMPPYYSCNVHQIELFSLNHIYISVTIICTTLIDLSGLSPISWCKWILDSYSTLKWYRRKPLETVAFSLLLASATDVSILIFFLIFSFFEIYSIFPYSFTNLDIFIQSELSSLFMYTFPLTINMEIFGDDDILSSHPACWLLSVWLKQGFHHHWQGKTPQNDFI